MDYNVIIKLFTEHPIQCFVFTSMVLFFASVFVRGWPNSSSSEEVYEDNDEDSYEDDYNDEQLLSIEGKYNICIKEQVHPASPAEIRNLELTITRK